MDMSILFVYLVLSVKMVLSKFLKKNFLSNVFTVQDTKGLLQGFDLFLATGNTVFVGDTGVNARRFELVVVSKGGIQFLLGTFEVSLLLLEGLTLVLLLHGLVLDVLGLLGLVDGGVVHELVILLLGLGLGGGGLGFQAGEVGLDHLQHTDDTTVLGLHTLVLGVEDLRLLQQSGGFTGLGVEFLEDFSGLGDGGLGFLGVLGGGGVLFLLLTTDLSGLSDSLVQSSDGLGQVGDILGQLGDGGFQLVDLGVEGLDGGGLLLTGGLVGGQFGVTPSLVLGLFVGFFHKTDNQVLDQLLHLLEWVSTGRLLSLGGDLGQDTRVGLLGLTLQVGGNFGDTLVLVTKLDGGSDLDQRSLLDEGRQVLVSGTRDGTGAQDLDGLLQSDDLISTQLLSVLEVRSLLLASGGQISQVLGVVVTSGGGVDQVTLGVGSGLQLLGLRGRLVGTSLG